MQNKETVKIFPRIKNTHGKKDEISDFLEIITTRGEKSVGVFDPWEKVKELK
jgi:hypothetical protein